MYYITVYCLCTLFYLFDIHDTWQPNSVCMSVKLMYQIYIRESSVLFFNLIGTPDCLVVTSKPLYLLVRQSNQLNQVFSWGSVLSDFSVRNEVHDNQTNMITFLPRSFTFTWIVCQEHRECFPTEQQVRKWTTTYKNAYRKWCSLPLDVYINACLSFILKHMLKIPCLLIWKYPLR